MSVFIVMVAGLIDSVWADRGPAEQHREKLAATTRHQTAVREYRVRTELWSDADAK